jgi:hypothetical protein
MGILGAVVGCIVMQGLVMQPWAKGQSAPAESGAKSLTGSSSNATYGKMDGSGSVPRLIPFQAYLTDNNGRPVEGQHNLVFRIWDDPTQGTLQWSEAHTAVPVSKGMVNVLLGRDPPQGTPFGVLTFDGPRYVGVSVDGGLELVPRQQIVASIYAADADRAKEADHAMDADHAASADDAVNAGHAVNADNAANAQNAVNAQNALRAAEADSAASSQTAVNSQTAEKLVKPGTVDVAVTVAPNGNVGFRTSDPSRGVIQIFSPTLAEDGGVTWYNGATTARAYLKPDSGNDFDFFLNRAGAENRGITIDATGRVSMGCPGILQNAYTVEFRSDPGVAGAGGVLFSQNGPYGFKAFTTGTGTTGGTLHISYVRRSDGADVGGGSILKLGASGTLFANDFQTMGGDIAESFTVATPQQGLARLEAGMVVIIDPESIGKLRLASEPYDRRVAGIISGANGLRPGMVMKPEGLGDPESDQIVALTGRAWCWCDASNGAIEPGDLLTTSATPGHAMKVIDHARAMGAVLGKAMSRLESGKGLVLVLVSLQ